MKKTLIALAALLTFFAGNAFAVTYTAVIEDEWTNWPGYGTASTAGVDSINGSPQVENLTVNVKNGLLQTITVNFSTSSRQLFDSLFINNTFEDDGADINNFETWNYFVIDRGTGQFSGFATKPLAATGFYSVDSFTTDDYSKTVGSSGVRPDSPNSIDSKILNPLAAGLINYKGLNVNTNLYELVYDFEGLNISALGGLFIAYSQWCANDVIGGHAVPEPGTLLLFGTGMMGLGLYRRFRKN